jgi:hypothetical protein
VSTLTGTTPKRDEHRDRALLYTEGAYKCFTSLMPLSAQVTRRGGSQANGRGPRYSGNPANLHPQGATAEGLAAGTPRGMPRCAPRTVATHRQQ